MFLSELLSRWRHRRANFLRFKRSREQRHRAHFSTSGATAADTTAFDGLDRPVSLSHLDGSASYAYYGSSIVAAGGNTTQQCGPPSGCPYGYPVVSVDEAGKVHQTWTDAFGRLIEVDEPKGTGGGVTSGHGSVTISGVEQNVTVGPTCTLYDCGGLCIQYSDGGRGGSTTYWDQGAVYITVNGNTDVANYGVGDTTGSVASNLAASINGDSNSPVTASVSGSVITLTAKTTGDPTNYSLSSSSQTTDTSGNFSSASFTGTPSGPDLTGGTSTSGLASSPYVTVYKYDLAGNLLGRHARRADSNLLV